MRLGGFAQHRRRAAPGAVCRSLFPAWPIERRMSRQRSAWSRISARVLGQLGPVGSSSIISATGQLDRRQRRAQFVRRRRHHAAQIGQLLLARQRHLRRQQRLATSRASRSRPAANRAPTKIDADHAWRRQNAEAANSAGRASGRTVAGPQRQAAQAEQRGQHESPAPPSDQRRAQGQRGGRDGHRRQHHQGERVGQPAGQRQQRGQLAEVEQQHQHRLPLGQPLVDRIDDRRDADWRSTEAPTADQQHSADAGSRGRRAESATSEGGGLAGDRRSSAARSAVRSRTQSARLIADRQARLGGGHGVLRFASECPHC